MCTFFYPAIKLSRISKISFTGLDVDFLSDFIKKTRMHAVYDCCTTPVHRESKNDTKLLPITSPNIKIFKKKFTDRLNGKFATNSYLNTPPHLKYVATLPCEI